MTSTNTPTVKRVSRWLSPAGLVLAGLLLLLPFVAVSCDAPGGYGRGAAGSTTAYTGADLVTGDDPQVSPPEQLRPPDQRVHDNIGVQPLAVAAALLMLAGLVTAVAVAAPVRRRLAVAVAAALAAAALAAEQVTVRPLLESSLREQLTVPMPDGKQAGDYVHTQPGFWLCLGLLLLVAVTNTIGWFRLRRTRDSVG